ncbi:toxin-antitoxin system YwqK family antitoxin [Parvicella tangerina]|uniref:Toxin-antitoxin system YwqK family antitoxin n=1 Tax=Parvicella tangerina TaxID=2829795 RepID=A0A916JLZ9_9FLAO|nr:toxin-antitoxin system YwqK family antitoxin [Parvicella tangerina]CAG5078649.1 hypothetical protein CRYO30217_00730 [Parvicella tangerina]
MRQILFLIIFIPILSLGQIKRGGSGTEENNNTNEQNNTYTGDDPSKLYPTKGEKPVNCNQDLEFDPGNQLVYHSKTNKPFTGLCVSYFPNGKLERKASFVNGKDNDTAYVYYESGDIKAFIIHVNGVEHGTWGYWYDNGPEDHSEQQVAWGNTYNMGQKIGTWYFFKENGDTTKILKYENDMLDGECRYFYENGAIEKSVSYKKNKMDGPYITYYNNEEHTIKTEKTYSNDEPDGKAQSYYESGALKSETEYKNGDKEGKWTIYYENGQIKQTGNFKNDLQDGIWDMFQESGKNATTALYDDGVLLKAVEYDRFGKPKNDLDLVELNDLLNKKKSDDASERKKGGLGGLFGKNKKNKEEENETNEEE